MPQIYHWRTLEDGALLLTILGLLSAVQIVLSYYAAFAYMIISTVVLAFVPLGIVLVQTTAVLLLAEVIGSRLFQERRQPGTVLLSTGIVLGLWGSFYTLIFYFSPFTQIAYLVGYIVANTAGALITLILVVLIEWLFKR